MDNWEALSVSPASLGGRGAVIDILIRLLGSTTRSAFYLREGGTGNAIFQTADGVLWSAQKLQRQPARILVELCVNMSVSAPQRWIEVSVGCAAKCTPFAHTFSKEGLAT